MVVNVAHLPEEEEQEDRACDYIQNTVPYHLGRRGDDIGALRKSPTDGVREQHECEVRRGQDVAGTKSTFLGEGPAWCVPEQDIPEKIVSHGALILKRMRHTRCES